MQRSKQISAGDARRSEHVAHGTEPPESLPARIGPSWQLPGGMPGGLITDGMHAVETIAPCGVVDPVRVHGGLAGGEPAGNSRLLDSNGLPAGRDWQRRRHMDQLRNLVSC